MTSTIAPCTAADDGQPDRGAVGPLEDYLIQVALGRTARLRRQLGEPHCAVLDVRSAIVRSGGRHGDFVAALKRFVATQAQEQHALLHEVDAALYRALDRRARHLAEQAGPMGAELLHWWALRLVAACADDRERVRCVGLHLVWAHVLTGQTVAASHGRRRDGAAGPGPAAPVHRPPDRRHGLIHTNVSQGT